jgi:hypothetical protein
MRREDSGSISLYVVVMLTALMAGFGLVVDVGSATVAKGQLIHNAFAAARAGAEAMSAETFVTTGHVRIDPTAAQRAALAYLQRINSGAAAQINVTGNTVLVQLTHNEHPQILSMFGLRTLTVSGEGSATAVYGLRGPTP